MKLLDLYCGQGGASRGYYLAGFDITGVDAKPQPRYPYRFIQSDALRFLEQYGVEYDLIAASPPCQAYSRLSALHDNDHAELVEPTRELIIKLGKPYIMENVPGAPLNSPTLLCGTMFGLHTYRHRLFESNLPLVAPWHPLHEVEVQKIGRRIKTGDWYTAVGNFSDPEFWIAKDMGVGWMCRRGISQAIPPAYTEYLGNLVKGLICH